MVIGWFMWREKRDVERQEARHRDNLEAQQRIASAFSTNTTALMIAVEGMKSMDRAYAELAAKLKASTERGV